MGPTPSGFFISSKSSHHQTAEKRFIRPQSAKCSYFKIPSNLPAPPVNGHFQFHPARLPQLLTVFIGCVWVFHGLFSKLAGGIPRHRQIVGRILGEGMADQATWVIGILEIALGLWIFSGIKRRACAWVQTLALIVMNFLEILLAKDLLISAVGMVVLNLGLIALIWHWAGHSRPLEIRG
jgi:uncharacterized membrane protein YphA (DoxX/SURF4 family)